jgi:hypothetical protein
MKKQMAEMTTVNLNVGKVLWASGKCPLTLDMLLHTTIIALAGRSLVIRR